MLSALEQSCRAIYKSLLCTGMERRTRSLPWSGRSVFVAFEMARKADQRIRLRRYRPYEDCGMASTNRANWVRSIKFSRSATSSGQAIFKPVRSSSTFTNWLASNRASEVPPSSHAVPRPSGSTFRRPLQVDIYTAQSLS